MHAGLHVWAHAEHSVHLTGEPMEVTVDRESTTWCAGPTTELAVRNDWARIEGKGSKLLQRLSREAEGCLVQVLLNKSLVSQYELPKPDRLADSYRVPDFSRNDLLQAIDELGCGDTFGFFDLPTKNSKNSRNLTN